MPPLRQRLVENEEDDDSDEDSYNVSDDFGDHVHVDNGDHVYDEDDDSSTYGCHYMDAYICSLKSFFQRNCSDECASLCVTLTSQWLHCQ